MMKFCSNPRERYPDACDPVGMISKAVRNRINAARLVCVLMMMYVHVPGAQRSGNELDAIAGARLDHWLESILIEGPGRAGAALLSVVSGYLIVHTLSDRKVTALCVYKRRFKSIIVPMVFWALLTCVVYWLLDQRDGSFLDAADSWHARLNLVLFVYEAPYGATLHLAFLRDLFVCILLSPLLLMVLKRVPKSAIGLLGLIYLFEHTGQLYIILRPLVILAFAVGILLALRGIRLDALDRHGATWLLFTGVFAVLIIWSHAGLLRPLEILLSAQGLSLQETVLYPLCRLFGTLAIWCLLSTWESSRLTQWADCLVPYLFVAFCSHFLALSVLYNGFWMPLFGDRDARIYFLWFMSAPFIAMGASIVIVSATLRVWPPLLILIAGGRMSPGGRRHDAPWRLVRVT